MKKLIFSALVATALCVSSCGKDDNNGGGSTSLTGDWYNYAMYNNAGNKGFRWVSLSKCAEKTYRSISDTKFKHEYYETQGSDCKYTPMYYDYTASNGIITLTTANDSPYGTKGKKYTVNYEMKAKELYLYFKDYRSGTEVIEVLHKKGEDYSYLDPFVGIWRMTKVTVGQTERLVKEGECLDGQVVASSSGFSLYIIAPDKSGQCKENITTYKWVKEGSKYYDITDPQNKEELAFVFSENNTKLSYSTPSDNGLVTIYLTKVK